MKPNYNLTFYLTLAFLLGLIQPNYAQTTWEALFSKADKQLAKGRFSGAISKANGTAKTIRKKHNGNEGYFAWQVLYEAKVLENQGLYKEMDKKILEGLEKVKKVQNTDFDAFMTGFIKATDTYLESSFLLKAEKILNSLTEELKNKPDAFWQAEVDLRKAIINTYLEKLNLVSNDLPKLIKDWSALKDATSGKSGKLSSEAIKYRKQEYARALTLQGELFTLKGEYGKADSSLLKYQNTVSDLAGSGHLLNTRHIMAIGDNCFDQEDYDRAERMYEKAMSSTSKKQKVYMQILEKYIRLKILDKGDVDKDLREFEKIADFFSSDETVYHLTQQMLESEEDIFKKEYKRANKDLLEILAKPETILPRNHPIMLELYDNLYQASVLGKTPDLAQAEDCLKQNLAISKVIFGEESILHKYRHILLADYYLTYSEDLDKVKAILDPAPYQAILEQRSREHRQNLLLSNTVANYYDIVDKYKDALDLIKSATQSLKSRYGEKSLKYGQQLVKLADIQLRVGNYKEAEENMKSALKIIRKELSKNTVEYAEATSEMAKIYGIIGIYDEAEEMLRSSNRIYKKLGIDDPIKKAKAVEEMAFLYIRIGEYAQTEEILNELLIQKEKKYGKSSRQLINPLNQLASLELIKGDYTDAEKLLSKSEEIAKKVYGDKSIKTSESYALLAKYFTMIGDYDRAEEYIKQVIDIQKNVLGIRHVELGKSLTDLALIKFNQDAKNATESEKLLNQAKLIMSSNFDTRHPLYAEVLKTTGEIYVQTGRYSEGFTMLKEANAIWLEKLESRNLNSANVYILLGDVYTKLKRFPEAKENYTKAEEIFGKMLSREHPDYIKTESKLGQLYFVNGDYKESNRILTKTTSAYLDFIKTYFPALSEREKAKYWAKIQGDFEFYNSLAIKQAAETPELLEKMYNFRLATKAILLSTSQKVRQRILGSNDEELKNKYKDWLRKKEELTAVLAMSDEQISEAQISTLAMRNEINQLEKDLSEKSDLFADNVEAEAYTWQDVQKLLGKEDAAVEIIRFRKFENGFTDKISYAALVVTQETKKNPRLVLLENGNELEERYLQYYRNMIRFEKADKYSYEKYWKPIEQALGTGINRVFLSPDGVYNQINVESILIEGETYVIDKMNVRVVSNTKDLIVAYKKPEKKRKREKNKPTPSTKYAVLFGHPTFYLTASTNKTISDLPGTEVEINAIADILKANNWKVDIFKDQGASEGHIKSLESKIPPAYIHIATHGFFDDSKVEDDLDINVDKELLNDPLRKSGVLGKGAGDLLAKGSKNYDSEEGILTAYEVTSANLDNTLVILSACETGLGKVAAGEGVYGLQRAFLVAGADAVVMSLFKVNDEVTQKLMTTFIKKWIISGDKRKAFNEAQKEIKAEYKYPNYWGSFNMIGVN